MVKTLIEFTLNFLRVFFLELVYLGPILVSLILLISFMGYIIGRVEGWSWSDALYHAFINATTVGYGDFRPTKKLSKMLAVATAFVGLVFTGIVVAIGVHAVGLTFKKVAPLSKSSCRQGQLSTAVVDRSDAVLGVPIPVRSMAHQLDLVVHPFKGAVGHPDPGPGQNPGEADAPYHEIA